MTSLIFIIVVVVAYYYIRRIDKGTWPKHEETWMPGYGLMDTTSGFWFAPGCVWPILRLFLLAAILYGVVSCTLSQ